MTKRKITTSNDVFLFVKNFLSTKGYSPSTREIAEEFSCSTSTVSHRLRSLRERGIIIFEDGKNRTLRICKEKST